MASTEPIQALSAEGKDTHVQETGLSDDSSLERQSESRRPLKKRILAVLWDSFDKSPEERKFVATIDWWILTYCCIAYFVKYLDQTNVRYVHHAFLRESLANSVVR